MTSGRQHRPWGGPTFQIPVVPDLSPLLRSLEAVSRSMEIASLQYRSDITESVEQAQKAIKQFSVLPTIVSQQVAKLSADLSWASRQHSKSFEAFRLLAAELTLPAFKFPLVPDFQERLDKLCRDSGFSFVLWESPSSLMVRIMRVPIRQRAAFVTNMMLVPTRSPELLEELHDAAQASRRLRERWPIIEDGIDLHVERRYGAAVRILLPEVEGLIAELLILNGRAAHDREGKLIALHENRTPVLTKNGKARVLVGLHAKAHHAARKPVEPFDKDAEIVRFVDALIPERNAILHGQSTNFGTARLSAQIVFLVYELSLMVAARDGSFSRRGAAYEFVKGQGGRSGRQGRQPRPNKLSVSPMRIAG